MERLEVGKIPQGVDPDQLATMVANQQAQLYNLQEQLLVAHLQFADQTFQAAIPAPPAAPPQGAAGRQGVRIEPPNYSTAPNSMQARQKRGSFKQMSTLSQKHAQIWSNMQQQPTEGQQATRRCGNALSELLFVPLELQSQGRQDIIVQALVDSGASRSFVGANLVEQLGLRVNPTPIERVRLATGAVIGTQRVVKL